jgi:hypothetical protein
MLDEILGNGGRFWSPRPDDENPGHYETYLTMAASKNQRAVLPDEYVQAHIARPPTKYANALFPDVVQCPHPGCYSWRFRS